MIAVVLEVQSSKYVTSYDDPYLFIPGSLEEPPGREWLKVGGGPESPRRHPPPPSYAMLGGLSAVRDGWTSLNFSGGPSQELSSLCLLTFPQKQRGAKPRRPRKGKKEFLSLPWIRRKCSMCKKTVGIFSSRLDLTPFERERNVFVACARI